MKKLSKTKTEEHLKLVLADTFVLYMKTYAVHWNFKGAKFFSVHKLTEEHYEELAIAIDEIAERIRARGDETPISLSNILNSADLQEIDSTHGASGDNAIKDLYEGHMVLSKRAKEAAQKFEEEEDLYSHDMMVARIGAHEKAAWMLKSFLQGSESEMSSVNIPPKAPSKRSEARH